MRRMGGTGPEVWIATSDGRGMIRADAIVAVQLSDDGAVMTQLAGEAETVLTVAAGSGGIPLPADFHRQLIRAIAELADASGALLVRSHRDDRGWRWITEPL